MADDAMPEGRCGTCRFFYSYEDLGSCRRFPPTRPAAPHLSALARWHFPQTNSTDWCGEFKPHFKVSTAEGDA